MAALAGWVLAGAGTLAVAGAGWWAWRGLLIGLSAKEQVAWNYAWLRRMAPRLGVAVHPWDTPAEFAVAMQRGLTLRRSRRAWLRAAVQRDVEQAVAGISLVTHAYERVSYAPTPPDAPLMHQVWRRRRRLRWRLWKLWALSTRE